MSGRPETRTITESEIEELPRLLTEAVLADTMRREHGRPDAAVHWWHLRESLRLRWNRAAADRERPAS